MFRRKPLEVRVALYDDNEMACLKMKLQQAQEELQQVKAELKQAQRDRDRMASDNISLMNRLEEKGGCNTNRWR